MKHGLCADVRFSNQLSQIVLYNLVICYMCYTLCAYPAMSATLVEWTTGVLTLVLTVIYNNASTYSRCCFLLKMK